MAFRLLSTKIDGKLVHTWMPNEEENSRNENYFTILIGRNGTGKSRLISEVCSAFRWFDFQQEILSQRRGSFVSRETKSPNNIEIRFSLDEKEFCLEFKDGKLVGPTLLRSNNLPKISSNFPNRVLATTISPFDKFPLPINYHTPSSKYNEALIYRYIGSKNRAGFASSTGYMSNVIESLFYSSSKKYFNLMRLSQVFDLLGYQPKIAVEYIVRLGSSFFNEFDKNFRNSLNRSTKDFAEIETYIRRIAGARNFSFEAEIEKDPDFIKNFYEAIISIQNILQKGSVTIEFNFQEASFNGGSLKLFERIRFLRRFGIMALRSVWLESKDSGQEVNLKETSSGEQGLVLTLLGIASEIEDNSLIIIDEPEISLHPEWQEKFIDLLTSVFNGYHGCHFLLATHSPLILSKMEIKNSAVVMMENLEIVDASEFSRKSVDFQLAEAFNNPGSHNEYLARQGLAALRMASNREIGSDEFREKLDLLRRIRPKLDADDPVAQITDALIQMQEEASR